MVQKSLSQFPWLDLTELQLLTHLHNTNIEFSKTCKIPEEDESHTCETLVKTKIKYRRSY